ncbi:unnamed protein product [Phyllotreta striolata]|uniref:Uncharacterized protein n=1 Tax=Phyllotreta striolata TaxID=444603 RepID=A0A9N9TKN1_PHYSR|nr:unnamed protein product [Phyllotreta striolata]
MYILHEYLSAYASSTPAYFSLYSFLLSIYYSLIYCIPSNSVYLLYVCYFRLASRSNWLPLLHPEGSTFSRTLIDYERPPPYYPGFFGCRSFIKTYYLPISWFFFKSSRTLRIFTRFLLVLYFSLLLIYSIILLYPIFFLFYVYNMQFGIPLRNRMISDSDYHLMCRECRWNWL